MPLHSTFSHARRLVITIAKGDVLPGEVLDYLDRLDKGGARPYGKIFDVTALEVPFSVESIHAFAELVRGREREGPTGPVAIVVGSEAALAKARVFAAEASVHRPIRIFREQHEARRWLDMFKGGGSEGEGTAGDGEGAA
jgi:hypothetical protein